MKIVIFSINPIFPDVVTGGASKHLYHIARNLGEKGHTVEILCAQSKRNKQQSRFTWAQNVSVLPVLPFNLPFPQPYAVSGGDLAIIIEKVSAALQDADRFYIHDGEFLIPDVYESLPTITSFRDNIYPESVLGSFIGKADDVICVSAYSKAVIEHTAGRFYPELKDRMHLVNNGVDLDVFSPVDAISLAEQLGVDPESEIILLHPHRPEIGKGLPETIKLVDRLVNQYELSNIKVLVPEWIGSMASEQDSEFYNTMMRFMQDLGLRERFMFIPWMPLERMPELYSLGRVTLCLGNIVEAFGNVAYESLACGTPSIVARVGVHRSLMPDELIEKVNFGDIVGAADRVMAILRGEQPSHTDVVAYLRKNLSFTQQVETYSEIITSCKRRQRLAYVSSVVGRQQKFRLAPWCYFDGDRIYHDFQGKFTVASQLASLLEQSDSISQDDAVRAGIEISTWNDWVTKTWIVPAK
jgi:glycosyltransferase involved in cell wall biosynthesis